MISKNTACGGCAGILVLGSERLTIISTYEGGEKYSAYYYAVNR